MLFKKTSAALLLALPFLIISPSQAQNANARLFSAMPDVVGAAHPAGPREKHVVREKLVGIQFKNIDRRAASAIKKIDVELFNGSSVTLSLTGREERGADNYTWYGNVKGSPMSQAILTVVNGHMAGSITLLNTGSGSPEIFEIKADALGVHKLRQIDTNQLPSDEGHQRYMKQGANPTTTTADLQSTTEMASGGGIALTNVGGTKYFRKVDVMMLYSSETAIAAGAAIHAEIQSRIDSANATFSNNGLHTRLRLVHSAATDYSEFANGNETLPVIAYLKTAPINTLRTTHGADAVMLLSENLKLGLTPVLCGFAADIRADAGTAFIALSRFCGLVHHTEAHEMGHLYGARHDMAADGTTTPYPHGHAFGYPAGKWFTVMATKLACGGATDCVRLGMFSTPHLKVNGVPIGDAATADNARVVQENAYRLAGFRPSGALQEASYFAGNSTDYAITMVGVAPQQAFTVTRTGGKPVYFDSYDNARLGFADGMIALDIEGNAGRVFRMFQAAYNRAPDLSGAGYWIHVLDRGTSLRDVAARFIDSAEFTDPYGRKISNEAFVKKVYFNVLHREPDADNYAYWVGQLYAGVPRPDVLASISEGYDNRRNTAAAVSRGIRYAMYGLVPAPIPGPSPALYASPFGK